MVHLTTGLRCSSLTHTHTQSRYTKYQDVHALRCLVAVNTENIRQKLSTLRRQNMYIVQCSTWVTRQERDLISLEFNNSTEVTLSYICIYSYMSSEKTKIYKAGQSQRWIQLNRKYNLQLIFRTERSKKLNRTTKNTIQNFAVKLCSVVYSKTKVYMKCSAVQTCKVKVAQL